MNPLGIMEENSFHGFVVVLPSQIGGCQILIGKVVGVQDQNPEKGKFVKEEATPQQGRGESRLS